MLPSSAHGRQSMGNPYGQGTAAPEEDHAWLLLLPPAAANTSIRYTKLDYRWGAALHELTGHVNNCKNGLAG